MYLRHASEIWRDHPELVPGVLFVNGITKDVAVGSRTARFHGIATSRLATNSETELPEVQAWRRVFSRMGLKPTQYRCASESLLRRFRKEKTLPQLHPLIDLCNSISMAFAIPVAVLMFRRCRNTSKSDTRPGLRVTWHFLARQRIPNRAK
jgi:DNA/RNA-binding domain of Phe-tRNA-synthetase-like protein